MPAVELRIDGTINAGFISGSVSLSMDKPASTFDLAYDPDAPFSDGPGDGVIEAGDECVLRVTDIPGGDEVLLTGFVDRISARYDADSRTFRVSGRSKNGDLADGSCMHTPRTWRNKTIDQIANDAADGYASSVIVVGEVGDAFDRIKFQVGEPPLEVIRKVAKQRGFWLFDSPDGNLLLDRVGVEDSETHLRYGENVIAAERTEDWSQRMSSYHYCGATSATDDLTGKSGRQLNGEVDDPMVAGRGRYRPLAIAATGAKRRADLGRRAIMERNMRAGKSERINVTFDGWADDRGLLWRPGVLVTMTDAQLRIDNSRFVVADVRYKFGANEPYLTELTLTRPEAYDLEDYPARARGDLWFAS